jgi:hypothetical protein
MVGSELSSERNGVAKRRVTVRASLVRAPSKRSGRMPVRRRLALVVGGVGCFVLLLSVWHCTEALAVLTGSSAPLAFLMAVGIDCGLVACEVAGILARKGAAKRWAGWYVAVAVVLSAMLNALACGRNAEECRVVAYGVGAVVPALVLMLSRVAGCLWTDAE